MAGSHLRRHWCFHLGFCRRRSAQRTSVRAFSAAFRRILNFRMCMTFVSMSEPSSSFLFAAHKSHPLVTTAAQTFPNVWVAIHASSFLRLLKWATCRSADTVGETFVIPEGAVLQNQPSSRLANPTPSFALISVTTDPARRIEISIEAELLLVWYEVRVWWIYIFRRGRNLFLV